MDFVAEQWKQLYNKYIYDQINHIFYAACAIS